MSINPIKLFDELVTEYRNYRCEYLEVLTKKYVKDPDEDDVEICVHNLKVIKCANLLKSTKERPFGYASSYECKTAKKTAQYWKKRVILHKRASFRKYVGAESSADLPANLKYLSRKKAYKTLLTVQKNKSFSSGEECESTLLNGTEFDEEDESTLSYGDCSLLSDTVKFTPKKRPNKISDEDETIKTLTTKDKYSFSANNIQEFSNFQIKNCSVNLLKPNNHKKLDLLIENFSTVINNSSIGKAPKIVCQKVAVHFKGISSPKEKDESNSSISAYSDCSGTSFLDYISSKSTPKFKFSDIGLGISNKNSQTSSFCNVKSLPYASNNSTKFSEMGTFNKNCKASSDCNSKLSCASNKSTNGPKLRPREDGIVASNENCRTSNDSITKSLSCAPSKLTQASKLRPREGVKVMYDKNCRTSSNCNASSYVPNKSTQASKLRPREDRKNCQSSSDCNRQSLSYASTKSVKDPNLIPRDQTSESLKSAEDSNLKCRENRKLISNKNCDKSNDCNTKSLSNASNKSVEDPNLKPREGGKQTSYKNSGISNDCDSAFCAFTKSTEDPNLKQRQDENLTCGKNCGKSSNYNAKTLSNASNKSIEGPGLKPRENRKQTSNKDSGISNDCNSAFYVSNSIEDPNLKEKRDEKSTSKKNCEKSSSCNANSLSSASYKSSETPKLMSSSSYDSSECIKILKARSREDERLASSKDCQTSSNCIAKSLLSYTSNKCTKTPNLKSKEKEIVTSDENCQSTSDSNAKSVPYVSDELHTSSNKIGKQTSNNQTPSGNTTKTCTSNKCTESPKLRPWNNGAEVPNKIVQTSSKSLFPASNKLTEVLKLKPKKDGTETFKTYSKASNVRNAKSLIYASDKSVEPHKYKYSDIETRPSNRNRQTLLSSFPLRCTSLSSSFGSNLGISMEIDPLSLRRVSDSKRPHKKKSSLSQSTLPFNQTKSYKKYLDEGVKLDDLSIRSSPKKTPKNKQKDESIK